jgi:hypothetical protein
MKACLTKRKRIALLATNSLEIKQEQELRAHLDGCPGCRRYFEEISGVARRLRAVEPKPDGYPPPSFHRNLKAALAETQRESVLERLWVQVWVAWGLRFALPAGVAAALVIAAWLFMEPRANIPVPALLADHQIAAPIPKSDLEPTFANYEMAVHQSFDKLDELLTEQGNRNRELSPIYTAARLPLSNMAD